MTKLGTDTGSLVNYMYMSGTNRTQPEVGMGATICGWSDRHPATIQSIETIRGKTYIGITGDTAVRTDDNGFSESQEYDYTSNPNATQSYYRFDEKKQQWVGVIQNPTTGRWKLNGNRGLIIGLREKYYDFSF